MRHRLLVLFLTNAFITGWVIADDPDPRPASFFGTVTVDGNPVADGTRVSAAVGGSELAVAFTFTDGADSVYRLDVPGDDPTTPQVEGGVPGQTVVFRIESADAAESGVWGDGVHARVDLTGTAGTDLAIAKDDGVAVAAPGDTLTYTLTVTNQGPLDATGVLIEDLVPASTSLVAASDGGTESGGVVTWPAFDLADGAVAVRTLTVQVAGSFPGGTTEIVNTATVRTDGADGIDPDPADNTATDVDALAGGPDVAVEKSANLSEVQPGEDVIYTLTLSNHGFQDALEVELTDDLPADVIFLTASDDGGEAGGVVTWPPVTLAIGETRIRTVRVRLPADVSPAVSQLTNTASATASVADLDPSNNTSVHVLPVVQETDLAVLAVDPAAAAIDPQTLQITGLVAVEIENGGNADATAPFAVTVFEDLDGDGALSAADNVLGEESVAAILIGETLLVDVPVSGTVAFRNNLLYAFADSGEVIPELDEANNVEHSARGCESIPTPEDFAPVVELSWPVAGTDTSFSADSLSTPIVVQLTDDNGDGRRDERDVPDLVFVSIDLTFPFNPQPRLRAIRGDTGAAVFDVLPPVSSFLTFALTGMAAGDIDLDGRPEIIVSVFDFRAPNGRPNRLAAYEHNGTLKWFSSWYSTHPDGDTLTNRDNPTIADLDRDGVPEILVGANVFNANGSLRWTGAGGHAYQSARNADGFDSGAISIAADLDLSGDLEVVTGNTAYRSDGSIYWQVAMDDGYPAVANFDADPFPEIVVVARGRVRLHEHDGTLIWGPVDLPGAGAEAGGAPTIANFDADPEPEIGVAGSTMYAVFEPDGAIKWQSSTQDGSSNMTGSTVFDLDGNGRFEVIYRDETALRIYRGEDGVVLYELPLSSITLNEQPVVADVDRDGNAEIIVSSDVAEGVSVPQRTRGLRVIGDANDNWVAARPVWNQHAYHIDNVEEDSHGIPAQEQPSWLTHNTYRANVAPVSGAFASPDVSASRIAVDLAAYPTVAATARIGNGGTAFVPGGLSVAFYDGDPAAGGQLLGTAIVAGDLDPGAFEDVAITFPSAGFGTAELFVVADDDGSGAGAQNECDEANNVHGIVYDTADVGLLLTMADGDDAVNPGELVTYTLTIANANLFARTGVQLTDVLPPDTFFAGASDGGAEAGGVVSWPLFTLAAGATVVRTLTFEVDPAIPVSVTSLTNAASVTDDGAGGPDPTPGNNSASDTNLVLTVRADAGGPYAGDEGVAIGFDASASSDRDGTVVAYAWDLDGDGVFDDGSGVTASFAFPDNGIFTVAVRVTDDSGEVDTDTAEVTVGNLPPAVDAGPDRTLTEGDATTLTATTFTDPGAGDTHTATIDWGDGTPLDAGVVDQAAGSVAGGHDYPDDGAFDVEVCVTDDDGDTACDGLTVTVENSAPIVIEEGDVDLRTWTPEHLTSAANWSVAGDGGSVTQTLNTDPSVFYGPFTAIGVNLEGSIRVNTSGDDDFIGFVLGFQPGDFSNPNADYLLIDWKQGNQSAFGQTGRRGLAISRVRGVPTTGELWGHLDVGGDGQGVQQLQRGLTRANSGWADFTSYVFTFQTSPTRVRVFVNGTLELDVGGVFNFGAGRFGFYNFSQGSVQYNAFSAQGIGILEGGTAELEVPFNDVGVLDTHTATIDWQDGTVEPGTVAEANGSGAVTGSHIYPDDATLDIQVCVTDDDGGVGCGTIPAVVNNLPPVLDAGADRLAYVGEGLDVAATFTDPGVLDTHTATLDWGDGNVEGGTVDEAGGAGTVSGFHEYTAEGAYTVEVCVTDDDGDTACDGFEVTWLAPILDVAIDKRTATHAVRPDQQVVYDLFVVNEGTREPRDVVVTDTLPPFLDFVAASDGGVFDAGAGTVTWSLPVLPFKTTLRLQLTLQAQSALPFNTPAVNTVAATDDGRFGPDVDPGDNSDSAGVLLWDGETPIVVARPPINLSRTAGVAANVSSTESVSTLASRGIDGNLSTSWFTLCGDAANQGASPFFEVELPRPASVRELRLFGNRQNANGRDFFAGAFRLFATDGTVLYDSGEVDLPAPTRDLTLVFPEIAGVRRARFTATADESCNPGLAELEVIGFYGDEQGDLRIEGTALDLDSVFFDSEPLEGHTATLDWGDGTAEAGVVAESGGEGTIDGVHVYPDDAALRVDVCVTDDAGNTGCDGFDLAVLNGVPDLNDDGGIDLRLWQAQGLSGGFNWIVADDGGSVRQTLNGPPTFFFGDFEAFGTRVEGTIEVTTSADDDFIGFALGYEPGDISNPDADYLLVAWKRGTQTWTFGGCGGSMPRTRGLVVSRVSGIPIEGEFWGSTNHPCNGLENGLETLARGTTLGTTGWAPFTPYEFTFEYSPTRLRVLVDGVLQVDLEGSFPDGRLTFYNHSHANVRYSAFTIAALVGVEGTPVEQTAFFTDVGLLDTHTATLDWADGEVSAGTVDFTAGNGNVTATHTYADNATYASEICVTDDDGGVGCGIFPVEVLNVAPVVDAGQDLAGGVGVPLALDPASFSDPGTLDTHTATVDWGDGTVEAGAVVEADGAGTVDSSHAYAAPGTYAVEVCVTDDDGGVGCDSLTVTVVAPPVLGATKVDAPTLDVNSDGVVNPGDRVAYTITVANTGLSPATGVTLADAVPANAAIVAGSVVASQGTVISEDPVQVDLGSVAAGASATVSFEVEVLPLPLGTTEIANQAVVSSNELADVLSDDPDLGGADDPTRTPVAGDPDLAASKTDALAADHDGDGVPSPGDEIGYTIVVGNAGSGAASGVVLRDLIPAHASVVAGSVVSTAGSVVSEDPVEVDLGTVAAGASATVSFSVRLDSPVPAGVDRIVNQATVLSNELPAVLSDDPDVGGDADPTATTITAAPDLAAEKSDALFSDEDGDGVPSPGDVLEYTVRIFNNGNTSATGVVLEDAIAEHTSLVAGSVTSDRGTVESEDPVTVAIGEIAGGMDTATVTFRVVVDDPIAAGVMEVVNQGVVTSAELPDVLTDDPDVGGGADPTATMIQAEPSLRLAKVDVLFEDADGDGVPSPGDALLYQLALDNDGNTAATGVTLADAIPAHTTLEAGSVQTSQGSVVSEDPVEIELGQVAVGTPVTVSLRVRIDEPFPTDVLAVSNQATVSSAELADVASDDPDAPGAADPTVTEVFITPEVQIGDVTVTEGNVSSVEAVFAVSVSAASNRSVSVAYATANGSALAGADYAAASGSVVIAAGETSSPIVVQVLPDPLDELDETFTVTLASPSGAVIADGVGVGTILDDDPTPAVSISDVTITEGAGTVDAVFTVSLSSLSSFDVGVDFATSDVTAAAGADYLATSGTVVIPAAQSTATVTVPVLGDLLDEDDETFTVSLTNLANALPGDVLGLGTILDDDEPPAIEVGDVTVSEGDPGGSVEAVFPLTLSAPSGRTVTIDYATDDGEAAAGADYQAVAGSLALPPGEVAGAVSVPVIGDDFAEADETFRLLLSSPQNVTVEDGEGVGTILDDDVPELTASKVDVLVLDADADGAVSPGDTVGYAVTLANVGTGIATGVVFTDAIPAHTSVVAGSVTTSQGTVETEDPVRIAAGDVGVGAAVTVAFEVVLDNPIAARVREISNQGTVTSGELPPLQTDDPDVRGAEDPTVTPVSAAPVLVAAKVDSLIDDVLRDGGASPGDTLAYEITITNPGNTSATDVVLLDPVPLDTVLVAGSAQSSQGTVATRDLPGGQALEVTIGEIAGGGLESVTVRFQVLIDRPLPGVGEIVNQGVLSSFEVPDVASDDPDLPGAEDPTVTPVVGCNYGLMVDFAEGCGALFVPEDCGACEGKVTELTLEYLGTGADAFVEVVQKKDSIVVFSGLVQPGGWLIFSGADDKGTLSSEVTIYVDGAENARLHTSCSQPIGPGVVEGDFLVVDGWSRQGGPLCPLPLAAGCGECKGKVTELTLEYRGAVADAFVEVVRDDADSDSESAVAFAGTVQPGEALAVAAPAGETLGKGITIHVDGVENTRIHTSCSQPIGPGLASGDFLVLAGASDDGGPLCALPAACAVAGAGRLTIEKDELRWELTNVGLETATVAAISLLWPDANGDLQIIRLDSKKIYEQPLPPPAAVIDSGWSGKLKDREIASDKAKELRLEFALDAVPGNLVCDVRGGGDSDSGDSDGGDSDSDSGDSDGGDSDSGDSDGGDSDGGDGDGGDSDGGDSDGGSDDGGSDGSATPEGGADQVEDPTAAFPAWLDLRRAAVFIDG